MKRKSIVDKEIDDLENSEKMENDNTAYENISFTTSTPKKRQFECEECKNESQCTDFFVKQVMIKEHRVHFSDEI